MAKQQVPLEDASFYTAVSRKTGVNPDELFITMDRIVRDPYFNLPQEPDRETAAGLSGAEPVTTTGDPEAASGLVPFSLASVAEADTKEKQVGIKTEDLPTDAAQIETDTEVFFEDGADQTEAILVLGQLDPLETVDGQPRWTAEQQKLIVNAGEMLKSWQE